MAVWYIDPSIAPGDESDTFEGEFGTGKRRDSWADVTWAANDSYYGRAGVQATLGAAIAPNQNGITLGAYNRTNALPYHIINGTGITRPISVVAGVQDLTVQDIDIFGGRFGFISSPSSAPRAERVTIQRCYLHDSPVDNDLDSNLCTLWANDIVIRHCVFNNCDADCIWVLCTNLTVEHCRFTNFGLNPTRLTGDAIQVSGGWSGTLNIKNNYALCDRDKQCFITNASTGDGVIRVWDNEFIGGIYVINVEAPTVSIKRNMLRAIPIVEAPVLTVITVPVTAGVWEICDNVIDGGSEAARLIHVSDNAASTLELSVDGNYMRNSKNTAFFAMVAWSSAGGTLRLRNNMIDNSGLSSGATTLAFNPGITLTMSNNRFRSEYSAFCNMASLNYSTVAALVSGGQGTSLTLGDPQVTADHRPLPGSPLLGAGTHLGYRRDLRRIQRPNPPAIGAYDLATFRPAGA